MDSHQSSNEASSRASGIEEEYDEKTQLLDELHSEFEDWKTQDKVRLDEAAREAERIENMGLAIRAGSTVIG
ncbi:hypothetical protein DYB32_009611 [Aphanomyces invadans]|uniref:Uncharacterized protein n=1 Tax=Aphanomyces invadans TaxID=157072 RepID=A0A3R6Y196_9STRA|nr:hypothetical protein DYB32_009611 [Aphanomyces invadans]